MKIRKKRKNLNKKTKSNYKTMIMKLYVKYHQMIANYKKMIIYHNFKILL